MSHLLRFAARHWMLVLAVLLFNLFIGLLLVSSAPKLLVATAPLVCPAGTHLAAVRMGVGHWSHDMKRASPDLAAFCVDGDGKIERNITIPAFLLVYAVQVLLSIAVFVLFRRWNQRRLALHPELA